MNLFTKRPSGNAFVFCLLITGIAILYGQTELTLIKTTNDKNIPANQLDNYIQSMDSVHKPTPVRYYYR